MTKAAATRIQVATAKQNNGHVPPNSFGARAQSIADKNAHAPKSPVPLGPSKTGKPSGKGRGNNPAKK